MVCLLASLLLITYKFSGYCSSSFSVSVLLLGQQKGQSSC